MIRVCDLNGEMRWWLDGFSGHEVELILQAATELMNEIGGRRARPGMGPNGAVELVCVVLAWLWERSGKCEGESEVQA